MLTFRQFLVETAQRGGVVNGMFEERLFGLIEVLHKISIALDSEGIAHELIGGLAVLIHVEEVNPELSSLTRDVDLMIQRSDLERINAAAAKHGFTYRHAAGVDMLLYSDAELKRYAVHLIFSGEKVRASYPLSTPSIQPERKQILGVDVNVVPSPIWCA